jgi:serine/threonine protein kinase
MTPERWAKIEELYNRALKIDRSAWPVFLRQACEGDGELQQEVERLLTEDQAEGSFLEEPAFQVAAQMLCGDSRRSLAGNSLGPYQELSFVGKGGMGEVYRGRDTRLNRFVAIKVLPEHVGRDPQLKRRFHREAQTLAKLSHPHICPVFDFGEQDGVAYLVMEFLAGQTLAERLQKGALPRDEALKIAMELADALDKAHSDSL